jgi:hypothetical protein
MSNDKSIREMLRRSPFKPFEVIMSSGEFHLIKHPENVILGPSRLVAYDLDLDQVAILDLEHVTELRITTPQQSS